MKAQSVKETQHGWRIVTAAPVQMAQLSAPSNSVVSPEPSVYILRLNLLGTSIIFIVLWSGSIDSPVQSIHMGGLGKKYLYYCIMYK